MAFPFIISLEPITKKGIQESNPEIRSIYSSKKAHPLTFTPVAAKQGGTAIGTIFERAHFTPKPSKPCTRWLGKIGTSTRRLREDLAISIRTLTKKEINLDTIREKLGYDLYQELGRGSFKVPKTRLSTHPIIDPFTITNELARILASGDYVIGLVNAPDVLARLDRGEYRIDSSLRIMSRYVDGYHDFQEAQTLDGDRLISFIDYLHTYYRPPPSLRTPDRRDVPLKGVMEMVAVGRVLADIDIIGGSGGNAGFVWVKDDSNQFIEACAVKIDPGECFKFKLQEPERGRDYSSGPNWVVNTFAKLEGRISEGQELRDLRDLQVAQNDTSVTLLWDALSLDQQTEFLSALFNCSRYLQADEILKYLFYRDGEFNRSPLEQIPEEVASQFQHEMKEWLQLQLEIYQIELQDFKCRFPEIVLRAHYIDKWGELPLPASDVTFPIRELFTQLTLIETPSREASNSNPTPELPERDSLLETQERMDSSSPTLALDTLFDAQENQPFPRKVLLIGRAGIGKSTLCQKIAHDHASGRLWSSRYKAVYWLPLRELNPAVEEGGFLALIDHPDQFLAHALAHIALKDPSLIPALLHQIEHHRQEILILLDGYDEATPALAHALASILHHPEMQMLLTSRPGVTESLHPHLDRLVENIGFSKEHISQYVHKFFERGSAHPERAKDQAKKFLEALQKERSLFAISHIPLQLQMLCVQWEQGAEVAGFAPTLAGLYRDMVDQLFRWECRKAGIRPYDIPGRERVEVLALLGKIALKGLEAGKLIIPREIVQNLLDTSLLTEMQILRTGLLRASGEGVTREYCFLHLTFQEYVIAFSVTQKPASEQKAFIVEHRCKPQFQLVLALMAGIIDYQDLSPGKEKLKQFFDHLHTPPGDLAGFYQMALTLRCLQQCSDSVIQEWIEEKYHVYSAWLELLPPKKEVANRQEVFKWALSLIDYLRSSDRIIYQKLTTLLCAALRDSEWEFRSSAEKAIGELFQRQPADQLFNPSQLLIQVLQDPDQGVRSSAVVALGHLCQRLPADEISDFSQPLLQAVRDLGPFLSKSVVESLEQLCQRLPVDQLLQIALHDSDCRVRSSAVHALEQLYQRLPADQLSDLSRPLLQIALRDSESYVRSYAVRALGNLCQRLPVDHLLVLSQPLLQSALQGSDENIRSSAVKALEQLYQRLSADQLSDLLRPLLQSALQGSDENARSSAISALGELCQKLPTDQLLGLSQPLLRIALRDSLYSVRSSAVWALGELFQRLPADQLLGLSQPLLQAIRDTNNYTRHTPVKALEQLCQRLPVDQLSDLSRTLFQALHHSDYTVQIPAVHALKQLSHRLSADQLSDFSRPLLQIALRDSDRTARIFAVDVLQQLCQRLSAHHLISFSQLFSQALHDSDRTVRSSAVEALEQLYQQLPADQLSNFSQTFLQALHDSDRTVRISAVNALRHLHQRLPFDQLSDFSRPLLQIALHDSDWDVRYSVVWTLGELCQRLPIDQLSDLSKPLLQIALCYSDCFEQTPAVEALEQLYQRLPVDQLSDLSQTLLQTIQDSENYVYHNAVQTLGDLCQRLPVDQFSDCVQSLFQALRDSESYVRYLAAQALGKLCQRLSTDQFSNFVQSLFQFIRDSDSYSRYDLVLTLNKIPLIAFTYHLKYTAEYLEVYSNQICIRKSPLSITKVSDHQFKLSLIENHREITHLISADEFNQLKSVLTTDHILQSYVTQYIQKESALFDLTSLNQWLRNQSVEGWQIQENEGEIALVNDRIDRSTLRSIRNHLDQIRDRLELDDVEIKLVTQGSLRIIIKGPSEEIQQLLGCPDLRDEA